MPELPEVQTIACGLEEHVVGRTIVDVDVRSAHAVGWDVARFRRDLSGSVIQGTGRRGKLLLLLMTSEKGVALTMGVHLRMTGRMHTPAEGEAPDKHTHVVFYLQDGAGVESRLFFHDQRKFGSVHVFAPGELEEWPFYATLGPEPLEISQADFVALFLGRRARIKGLLLDQKVIAGIGNIYADESLFRAGIRPDAEAASIGAVRLEKLHAVVQEVLQEAIDACGSSIKDYRDAKGDAGSFQNKFKVYGRKGLPCVECGAVLQSAKVAGRTSVFCGGCQR